MKPSPRFPARFYALQTACLAVAAIALLWIFHATRLDLALAAPYYDAQTRVFPWRHDWVMTDFLHRYMKYVLIGAGLATWAVALATLRARDGFFATHRRRWWCVALAFVVVPTCIWVLQRFYGPMHCPWDVDAFGGHAPYQDLWTTITSPRADVALGRCIPAAFVTSGSWAMAFALLWWPERKRASVAWWLGLFAASLAWGWIQQFRGAHFLSQTLWSLWITWAIVLVLHAATGAWREGAGRSDPR
ncbi:phosphoesterase [Lysobacter helvus]|uniref:Phosphoesterase n=2 Tax=Lysobacteraceae TaxID=32033 RepID=A0ABM7Q577_9GAMM|nr:MULTISPECIES: hypothetical protein [Lysobacter]BCT92497.1 phosphoesterase [Lysobacter caseinilyticus]BCT95650.1 phosphoesterase [Lysobacter helvus]